MSEAAVRVGVGTRFQYDGEVVVVEELFGAASGVEVLVRDGRGRRLRLAVRELMFSGRGRVIPEGPGPSADDPGDPVAVILAQLDEAQRKEVQRRAEHVREVLTGYQSGSPELAVPANLGSSTPRAWR
jgi:hypothetical protein